MKLIFLTSFLSALGKFWQDKTNFSFLRWNIFFIAFQFIYLFFKYGNLPSQLPLFFSEPWGESWLVTSGAIFLLPFFSLLIALANHAVALLIHQKWLLLARLLIVFSVIFSLFSSVALIQVIRLAT